jgi:hypothetical protein
MADMQTSATFEGLHPFHRNENCNINGEHACSNNWGRGFWNEGTELAAEAT